MPSSLSSSQSHVFRNDRKKFRTVWGHVSKILWDIKRECLLSLLFIFGKGYLSYLDTLFTSVLDQNNAPEQFRKIGMTKVGYLLLDTASDVYEYRFVNPQMYQSIYQHVWDMMEQDADLAHVNHRDNHLFLMSEKGVLSLSGIINKIMTLIHPVFVIFSRIMALGRFLSWRQLLSFLVLYQSFFLVGCVLSRFDYRQKKTITHLFQKGQSNMMHEASQIHPSAPEKIPEIRKSIIQQSLGLFQKQWRHQSRIVCSQWCLQSWTFVGLIMLTILYSDTSRVPPLSLYYLVYSIYLQFQYLLIEFREVMTLASTWSVMENLE